MYGRRFSFGAAYLQKKFIGDQSDEVCNCIQAHLSVSRFIPLEPARIFLCVNRFTQTGNETSKQNNDVAGLFIYTTFFTITTW